MSTPRDIFGSSVSVDERLQKVRTMTYDDLRDLAIAIDSDGGVQDSVCDAISSRIRALRKEQSRRSQEEMESA